MAEGGEISTSLESVISSQGRHRDVSCLEFSNFDIIMYIQWHIIWIHIILVESAFKSSNPSTLQNISMKTLKSVTRQENKYLEYTLLDRPGPARGQTK